MVHKHHVRKFNAFLNLLICCALLLTSAGPAIHGQGLQEAPAYESGPGSVPGPAPVNAGGEPLRVDSVTIQNNNFEGNGTYGLNSAITINAEQNWWGSANGPTHPGNPNGNGDAVSDNVDYDPWRTTAADIGFSYPPAPEPGVIELSQNSFEKNGTFGVNSTIPLNAENNWWGHPSGPYHQDSNPSGLGDAVSDNVDYDPWLIAPPGSREAISLTLGVPLTDSVGPLGFRDFYLETTAGQSLVLEVVPLSGSNTLWVYSRFGAPPLWSHYDQRTREPTARSVYELLIAPTQPGRYYFGVYGREISGAEGHFKITVRADDRYLSTVSPDAAGNTGQVTLNLSGLGFVEGMGVELRAASQPKRQADDVTLASLTGLWAHFDLSGAATGTYNVVAIWPGGQEAELANAFTINPGIGPRLEAQLVAPEAVRPNRPYVLWLEYGNSGDADMAAPLFFISSVQDAAMRLTDSKLYSKRTLQILGISFEQPAGLLRPGSQYRIPIYFLATNTNEMQLDLDQMVADGTPIDWSAVEAAIRPSGIDAQLWAATWNNLTVQLGSTQADYVNALGEQATYLGQYGSPAYDVQELLAAMMGRAAGAYLGQALAWSLDAFAAGPGLPLTFSRAAYDPLYQRFTPGPFGRSWSHNLEFALEEPDSETVVIKEPGGAQRMFVKDQAGNWQPSTGDYGELESLAGGAYRLREKDGLVWHFDDSGRLNYVEDLNGNRITLNYSGGRLSGASHSNGYSFSLDYNAQGRISTLTDQAGRETTYNYDASGEHLTSVVAPGGVTTAYEYVPATGTAADHAIQTITLPNGTHQYYAYDDQGRVAGQWRDGTAERVDFGYDPLGIVLAEDAFDAMTTWRLGSRSQLLGVEDPLGRQAGFAYDEQFNLTALTAASGATSDVSYDSLGNPVLVEDALGHSTTMGYTANLSRLDWLRDAKNNLTDFAYDSAGNLTAIIHPDTTSENFGHDSKGNLTTVANRRGESITLTYDALGQVVRKDYPDGRWITYTHDAVGRVTKVSDQAGAIDIDYDARGFMTRIEYPSGHWFAYTYSDSGLRTQRTGDDSYTLNYHYDAVGRLERLTDGTGAQLIQYEYDASGRLTKELKGNGTYTAYRYDAAGQILSLVNHAADDSVQSRFDYSYDANGNRTSMTTLGGTTTYEYDATGQLIGVTYPGGREVSYEYDAAGNRVSVTDDGTETAYSANNMNQYTSVGSATYAYDDDGNLTSKTDASGTTTYVYDIENRLTQVSAPNGDTWQYTYDALGNRVAVDHNGAISQYVHDPIGLGDTAAEYDSGGSLSARYVHGFGLIARVDAAGDPAFYGFDATGNTRQVTNETGSVANSYDYSPFGIPLQASETISNPFRYVGRYGVMDDDNGLTFMRARYYDGSVGRFITEDPLGFSAGDPNLYRYVVNAPTTYIDPSGEFVWPAFVITAALYLGVLSHTVSYYVNYVCTVHWVACQELTVGVVEFIAEFLSEGPDIPTTILGSIGYWLDTFIDFGGLDILTELWESIRLRVIRPIDPNEKTGPQGWGDDQIVSVDEELQYTVYFENVPTASAPAQEVFVTDTLDPDLDWNSFELTEIAYGDQIIAIGDADQFYGQESTLDYRDDVDKLWWVEVTVQLDYQNGQVSWTFRTLDPETGELPADPFAGFLPPNDASHRGEGHVSFSVQPKYDAPNGTVITNGASIVFDTNAPIQTNDVSNTVGVPGSNLYLPALLEY